MIGRLVLKNQNPVQLVVASIGALFGLLLLLCSLQLYLDFREMLTAKTDIINPQYVIINKKVSLLNTLGVASSAFRDEEIEDIKKMNSVEKVGAFESNLFSASAFVDKKDLEKLGDDAKDIPGFFTEMFFESVPDEYIDVKSDKWSWKTGDSIIPIILTADYINLYNFGFAPSQGLPQISKSTFEVAVFKIKVEGVDTSRVFYGRVAGFSDRINSILVPMSFLEYANKVFAKKKAKGPSRLILVSTDPASQELAKYLEDKGYETNENNLQNSKLASVLRIIMNVVTVIGGMIILLSLLGFIQYSQLMISRSEYEIKTLIQLGYYHLHIFGKYMIFYISIFSAILLLTWLILRSAKPFFISFMAEQNKDFIIDPGLNAVVYNCGIILFVLFVLVNGAAVYRAVLRLAKPS